MCNLDQYHLRHHGLSDTLAACPESRLVARRADDDGPFADRVDQLIAACASPAGARVLDYGCGAGQETDRLARAAGGHALGVDASMPMIHEAAATPRTRFAHAPNGLVPAGRHSFDVVHVSLTLGRLHGRNLTRAAGELLRVLKPGGLLVLVKTAGNASDHRGWVSRSDDDDRALFPGVTLKTEARLETGGDDLALLAGRRETAAPVPA